MCSVSPGSVNGKHSNCRQGSRDPTRQVLDNRRRAPWRLSSITDFFWSIADFVVLFFQSIIHPNLRRRGYASSSYSGNNDGRGPPALPRRRMGQINHWGGGPSPPPMAGGG
ncbi:selenoprotein K isoform 1-T1 [Guaruba guarouba]